MTCSSKGSDGVKATKMFGDTYNQERNSLPEQKWSTDANTDGSQTEIIHKDFIQHGGECSVGRIR